MTEVPRPQRAPRKRTPRTKPTNGGNGADGPLEVMQIPGMK